MSTYDKTHQPCSRCGSSDANTIYSDGHEYCFSCHTRSGDLNKSGGYVLPDLITTAIKSRGIRKDVASRYRVGIDRDTRLLHFPYFLNGSLVGSKSRSSDKQFRWHGGNTENVPLFGMQCAQGNKHLIITEGEVDALSAYQMTGYSAVSIPFGAQSAAKYIKKHLRWIEQFENVYICFDSDKQGEDATQQVISILKPGKAKIVMLPGGYKDASDMLVANAGEEFKKSIWGAQTYLPSGFIDKDVMIKNAVDWYFNKKKRVGSSSGFKGLDALIGGWRPGEVTVTVSGTGIGKSTLARQLTFNLVEQGQKCFFIPLEQDVYTTLTLFAELLLRRKIIKDEDTGLLGEQELIDAYSYLSESLTLYGHFGKLGLDKLTEAVEYAVREKNCDFVVLDHITAAVGTDEDERRALDNCMAQLKSLALQHNIHIFVVTHQSRNASDTDDTKPTLNRIRGSAGISQYADCVLALSRGRDTNLTELRTLKASRTWSEYGSVDLIYDKNTTHMKEVKQPDAKEQHSQSVQDQDIGREPSQEKDEQPSCQDQGAHIQESSGVSSMGEEQALPDRVRSEEDSVHSEENIRTGLHTSERDDGGGERVPITDDEDETKVYPLFGTGHQNPHRRYRNQARFHDACRRDFLEQVERMGGTDKYNELIRSVQKKGRPKKV